MSKETGTARVKRGMAEMLNRPRSQKMLALLQ
jgi:hypothetical protein